MVYEHVGPVGVTIPGSPGFRAAGQAVGPQAVIAGTATTASVYDEDAGDDLCDDEGELRPRHREAAVRAAAAVLGGEAARAFFDRLEW